jgi:hypothetical protein
MNRTAPSTLDRPLLNAKRPNCDIAELGEIDPQTFNWLVERHSSRPFRPQPSGYHHGTDHPSDVGKDECNHACTVMLVLSEN